MSAATFVVLRSWGPEIAAMGSVPALSLDYPQVLTLALLARGTDLERILERVPARTGAEPGAVQEFLTALADRELLLPAGPLDEQPAASEPAPFDAPDAAFPGDTEALVLQLPLVLRVTPAGFVASDHAGSVQCVLDPAHLDAVAAFCAPHPWKEALRTHRQRAGAEALKEAEFREVVAGLLGRGLLTRYDPDDPGQVSPLDRAKKLENARVLNHLRVQHFTDRGLAEFETREAERWPQATDRVSIVPVQHNGGFIPLGLGMVMAYAKAWDGGRLEEHYSFRPDWMSGSRSTEELTARPGIFMFSNYVWSHAANLDVSARVKDASPHSLTIHGGPDSPKYPHDVRHYFDIHPHVDVIVHGEGEQTLAELLAALVGHVGDGPPDLSPLGDVPGLSFRLGDEVVRTGDRERIADLDTIPSPLLTGLFKAFGDANVLGLSVETNRGCPYGCTFCDWGSATLSRIRKFDLDRVFAEFEWCGQNKLSLAGVADANFGIFERDVEIAEKIAEVKRTYGYPKSALANYAKNTTKHLKKIVQIWTDAGLLTNGLLSLQSVDPGTLETIRRKNIKVEKYNELEVEFRKAKLPLFVDLMIGLPGSTTESVHNDLQDCIEREVVAKIHPTTLLPNSPMNEPSYKAEHKIEIAEPRDVGRGNTLTQLVVSSSTFTREDMAEWKRLRRTYLALENFGILRHVARYVRHETGMREIDFYVRLQADARAMAERYPHIDFIVRSGPDLLAPPGSWGLMLDEVRSYLVDEIGVPDDTALATVLAVQHALLPARGRTFPLRLELPHDYVTWHEAMLEAKGEHGDWTVGVPSLRSLGAGVLEVDDPQDVCNQGIGYDVENGYNDSWEMASPVSRPVPVRPADV